MKKVLNVTWAIRSSVVMLTAAAAVIAGGSTAWAKDSITVDVTNASGPPVVVSNGQAVGTIQLFYTVNALEFPTGAFATFDLNWETVVGSGRASNYASGVSLDIVQSQQGGHVVFSASPASFVLTNTGQTGKSTITVFIANDKDGNAPSNADGTDLVGNLKLDAGSEVGTTPNIQVHIRLAHPTSCIKLYNFVTDQDFNLGILSTANLNSPKSGAKAGTVNSSQPGQFSDNVLVANACGTPYAFDLKVTLDESFSTNPVNNPGNAVFAYSAAGEFDPTTFGALLAGTGTGYQQNLCLQNFTVAPGETLLVTVKSKVKDGITVAALPADRTFDFSAKVTSAGQSCGGALDSTVSPNPATFALPFTVNNQ